MPAFRALLAEEGGDLARFYARVRVVAALPKAERDALLAQAASRAPAAGRRPLTGCGGRLSGPVH